MRLKLKRLFKLLLYLIFLLGVIIGGLEMAYRFQWIDFYKAELNGLNDIENIDPNKNRVLVIGDSFSADKYSYVKYLNENDSSLNYINSSIPGTGIVQHNFILKDRIEQYQPKFIIYQIYPSNDLIDIEKPINFSELSFLRNLYWLLSDKIRVLAYMNSRLSIFKKSPKGEEIKADIFDVEKYNNREKLYLKSDPYYLEKSIHGSEDYEERAEEWLNNFMEFKKIAGDIPVKLLVIPHAIQVDSIHKENLEACGASFKTGMKYSDFVKNIESNFPNTAILDPIDALSERTLLKSDLYYQNDPHLTKTGQQFLGKWMFKQLTN